MTLFFVTIGAATGGATAAGAAPVAALIALQLAVHIAVVFSGAAALKIPPEIAIIASNAAVGGPGTAAAMASARGWPHLLPASVFLGSLGYAVGTAAGLAMFQCLSCVA